MSLRILALRSISWRSLAAILISASALAAHADSSLQFVNLYVNGQGAETESIFSPTGTFAVNGSPGTEFFGNVMWLGRGYSLAIAPPIGQQLALGTYQAVGLVANASATQAGMEFGAGQCPGSGTFTILDLAYDSTQGVTRLAVDFNFRCYGSDAGWYGGFRFNSSVPFTFPSPPAGTSASFQYFSQVGDPVARGQSGTLTNADAFFTTLAVPSGPDVAQVNLYDNQGLGLWRMRFSNPSGAALVPGTYSGGVDVSSGIGCGINTSQFTVYEIQYGPQGTLTKFAVDFQQFCPGSAGGLFGGLRYNSDIPYAGPPASQTQVFLRASSVQSDEFVPAGTTIPVLGAITVDVNGNPVGGVVVRFDGGSCGTFNGATSAQVTSSPTGYAGSPPFRVTNVTTPDCRVTTSIPADPQPQPNFPSYSFAVFNPASFQLVAVPESVTTEINGDFTIQLTVRSDLPSMSGFNVTFSVPFGSLVQPNFLPSSGVADANNHITLQLRANNLAGSYVITAFRGDVDISLMIPVTQTQTSTSPPSTPSPPQLGEVQDMWWVGPAENGWGMSLIQHGDELFAALYVYDASGNPTWIVMTTGTWNIAHTAYRGDLYEPSGSPFYAYDTTHFDVGTAKGSLTITFQDANNATLDYTFGSASGHKTITREIFGADSIVGTDHTDLWWGGTAQNGWGITVMQQGATLFPIWFTYGANGSPLWYAMMNGAWTSSTTYQGTLYRTTGSPWIGTTYDPTKLQVLSVGTFSIEFSAINGTTATFAYTADGHSGTIPLVRESF